MLKKAVRFEPSRFPGEVLSSRRVGEFTLTETAYAPGTLLATHSHESACIIYVLRGTFWERYGDRQRVGGPGLVILRPAEEPHSDRFGEDGGQCLNVEITAEWLDDACRHAPMLLTSRSTELAGHSVRVIARQMADELAFPDHATPLATESLVLSTLAGLTRAGGTARGTPPKWLLDAQNLLHDDFARAPSLRTIAASVGIHPVTLAIAFRKYFGTTVAAYARQLRVEFACRQLVESDTPLAEIAAAAGFCDQSHFARVFKQEQHVTPSQYRRIRQRTSERR